MTEVILVALAIAIIVYGVWFCYQEGEIFSFVSKYGNKYVPKLIRPSLFQCPVCMVPWYGVLIYFAVYGHVNWWTVFVLAISLGINAIIVGFKPKEKPKEMDDETKELIRSHAKYFLAWYIADGRYSDIEESDFERAANYYEDFIQSLKQ